MLKNIYKNAIMLYTVQMIFIVMLLNNNFMKSLDIYQPANKEGFEIILGIIIFILNIVSIFVLRALYLRSKEEQQFLISKIKFKFIEEQNKIFRQNRHDLKNHLIIIAQLLKENKLTKLEEYLNSYLDEIDKSLISINTGINEIDILLYSKISSAKQKGINVDFKCTTIIKLSKKNILDLISIMGNIFDNAIEATEDLKGGKYIKINICEDPIDYIIKISNNFKNENKINELEVFDEGFTTKEGNDRGEGLKIVKKLVEKYHGEVKVNINDSEFYIQIELPKFALGGEND
ncbi:MAG: sensor histidine kinase [Thermoanaerobacteraceae bacterium]